MVIGSLFFRRRVTPAVVIALAFILPVLRSVADDQIVKNDGNVVNGTIVGVSGGQVTIETHTSNGGIAKFPITITDIKSISMAVPAEVAKAQATDATPGVVIGALEPMVKKYAGLPTSWIVDAMAQLGDAYSQVGQTDKALAVYGKIGELYPGSAYVHIADASKAQVDLDANRIDDALKLLQPIVDAANKNMAPSPSDGATYAKAFLVYGKVLVAQKKPQQALEAFLTVKTMFYQNPKLVAEADHDAKDLRDQNPGLGIE